LRHRLAALAAAIVLPVAAQTPAVPAWSAEARKRLLGGPGGAAQRAERAALVADAEQHLAAGDAVAALALLERAALMLHAPDTEMGIERARMQLGEYRRALAFAAHAAGAHRREAPAASALYAWLLHVGGQRAAAAREQDTALAVAPGEPALRLTGLRLAGAAGEPPPVLLAPPLRMAPYAAAGGCAGQAVGTATLVGDGSTALVPLDLVLPGLPLSLRNRLGQNSSARLRQAWPAWGLAWVDLQDPLPVPAGSWAAAAEPFGGSPASAVGCAAVGDGPAWPLLQYGFFGPAAGGAAAARRLGIGSGPVPPGAPVFDRGGLLAGVATSHAAGPRFVPLRALPAAVGMGRAAAAPAVPESFDLVYERGLLLALQVLR
jgi:hypothetical protein